MSTAVIVDLLSKVSSTRQLLYHVAHRMSPLVCFRTGDLVHVTSTEACHCGRTAPRFHVIGRTDEMIVVRGVNAFLSLVSAAVSACRELTGEYRVRLNQPGSYDRLPLEVELAAGIRSSDTLSAQLAQTIGDTLRLTVDLTLLAPGALPRTESKTKRVIKEYTQ